MGKRFAKISMMFCTGLCVIAVIKWMIYTGTALKPAALCMVVLCTALIMTLQAKSDVGFSAASRSLLGLFSLLFAVSAVFGELIVQDWSKQAAIEQLYMLPVGKTDICMMLLLSVPVYYAVKTVFSCAVWIRNRLPEVRSPLLRAVLQPVKVKHFMLGSFLLLLCSWSVFWLAYFPGTGMPDVAWIMYAPMASSEQHTLAYNTFLYALMIAGKAIGGSWNWGAALYSLVQMAYCAWTVSYILNWLVRRKAPAVVSCGLLAFFAFSRITPNISIVATKDVIFGFSFLLLIPLLIECAETEGESLLRPKNAFLFFAASAIILCFRNNGKYVIAVLAVFIAASCRRQRKQILILCLIVVLLPVSTDALLMKYVVKRNKLTTESLGIPLQQMAAVAARDGEMNEEEAAVLDTIMPTEKIREFYHPMCVDFLKWGEGGEYLDKTWIDENLSTFLKTWAAMLKKNPHIYLEAYLLETYSYWKAGAPSGSQGFFYTYPQMDISDVDVKNVQVLPEKLQTALEKHYEIDPNTEAPSGGTMIWLTLLAALFFCCTGNTKKAIACLPVILCWGTLMISAPIANGFRYVYPLFLCWPFFVALAVLPEADP